MSGVENIQHEGRDQVNSDKCVLKSSILRTINNVHAFRVSEATVGI